jgi:hypothetical protein
VAKRPTFGDAPDKPLNAAELEQLRRNLAHLAPHNLRVMYEQMYQECRLPSEGMPPAQAIQTLVQVWRQMARVIRQK